MITLPKVTKVGEHMRCLVQSRSKKGVAHMVDIYDTQCGCEDWQFNSTEKGSREFCIHVIAAKCAFADQMIAMIKQKEKQNARDARKRKKSRR